MTTRRGGTSGLGVCAAQFTAIQHIPVLIRGFEWLSDLLAEATGS
jgi:hypothetical protein